MLCGGIPMSTELMEINHRLHSRWNKNSGRTKSNSGVGSEGIAVEEGCSHGANKRVLYKLVDASLAAVVNVSIFLFFPHQHTGIMAWLLLQGNGLNIEVCMWHVMVKEAQLPTTVMERVLRNGPLNIVSWVWW